MVRLPTIKASHRPVRAVDGRILLGGSLYGVAGEIADDEDGLVWRLLELMDGTRSPEAIVTALRAEHANLDSDSVLHAIAAIVEAGYVEDAGAAPPEELSDGELERYSRSAHFFGWIDRAPRPSRHEIQRRLKRASVAVVGLGGSGSALAAGLVATGVGSVACFDSDVVELSNLNRQLLYDEDDLGASKVERAIAKLQRLNAEIQITGRDLYIGAVDDLVPIMADCDLLALCADTPREYILPWTNEAAMRTRTSWLVALHGGPVTTTGIYVPYQTPCFECMRHYQTRDRLATWGATEGPRAPQTPAIAPTAAITGHMGALEAIYFLGGLRPQTVGRLFQQSLLEYGHNLVTEPDFWDECPICGPTGRFPPSAAGATAARR